MKGWYIGRSHLAAPIFLRFVVWGGRRVAWIWVGGWARWVGAMLGCVGFGCVGLNLMGLGWAGLKMARDGWAWFGLV